MRAWKAISCLWWEVAAVCNLLCANFSRLRKSKIFWTEITFSALFAIITCVCNYQPEISQTKFRVTLDDVFFSNYLYFCLVISAGVGLILGTEHSEGTLRNKLIVGKTRVQVYISNLVTCIAASSATVVANLGIMSTLGYWLLDGFQMPMEQVAIGICCTLLANAAITAVCVLIAMNCSSKSNGAVFSMLFQLALLYATSYIMTLLSEPETISDDLPILNPVYISGTFRKILEGLLDLLPHGQMFQIYAGEYAHCRYWPWLSILLLTGVSLCGCLAFRRKNLK